jgi:DegV family protein with EDD domain
MKLGLVTDSTSDLPQYLVEEHGIEVVPCILVIAGKAYLDGQGISRSEFYHQLPGLRPAPTTAAPSIGEFASRYSRLLDGRCDHVLSIHATGGLTSIVESARQAGHEFGGRVTVVDSRSLSLGLGFQVLAAAEAAQDGLEAALAAVESTRRRLHLFAVLDALEYARRSGRLPAPLSILGGLLHIKPLIELTDGEIKTIAAVRTATQAAQRMADFLHSGGRFERLAILHADAEPRAREFLQRIMQESSQALPRGILLVNVTTVIGTHVGPNALGFAAVRASAPA